MTNISVNYSDDWLNLEDRHLDPVFLENCKQAMMTGEPGFSFNFGKQKNETLRNACTEVTSEDDSDVCNLGSVNLGNISSLEELTQVVSLASKFLVCGTLRADLPYQKVYTIREKNRRLGLGLMGIHEWLLQRGASYEVNDELKSWKYIVTKVKDPLTNIVIASSLVVLLPIVPLPLQALLVLLLQLQLVLNLYLLSPTNGGILPREQNGSISMWWMLLLIASFANIALSLTKLIRLIN
jgi:ribonucleoside-diphosphate reductase alpha chain